MQHITFMRYSIVRMTGSGHIKYYCANSCALEYYSHTPLFVSHVCTSAHSICVYDWVMGICMYVCVRPMCGKVYFQLNVFVIIAALSSHFNFGAIPFIWASRSAKPLKVLASMVLHNRRWMPDSDHICSAPSTTAMPSPNTASGQST